MIRTTLESILCLVLSPLLVAQQISHEPRLAEPDPQPQPACSTPIASLPPGTKILLLMPAFRPRPLSIGSPVELEVLHNIAINGTIVLRAGTTVTALLTDEKHGSFPMRRDETIRIHARDLQSGQPLRIRVPLDISRQCSQPRGPFPWTNVILALIIIILPIAVLRSGDN